MIIGIDFDNTLVSYDTLFHRVAREQGLIRSDLPVNKTTVRDHLRATGREALWTEMQGMVYGVRIAEAEAFPGALQFLEICRQRGVPVRIISHKTRHPYLGERHDLHAAARGWLQAQGFLDRASTGIGDKDVFFELTKADKLSRIAACGCTHFIDDLPELLTDTTFPRGVTRFLFDPQNTHPAQAGLLPINSWAALQEVLFNATPWQPALQAMAAHGGLQLAGAPLVPLKGGANNRVYRLPLRDGGAALVKHYFQHAGDQRDRFATERAFYRYVAALNLWQVPQALGWNEAERLGVFSFVTGAVPTATESAHVDAALDFIAELNRQRHRPEALALPNASEACFSLEAHLSSVQRRIDRMCPRPAEDALDGQANNFIDHELMPAWAAVCSALRREYDLSERTRVLPQAECCVSPSDFGFHNSLVRRDGEIVFIDFEYAGWDDPAKLACDFFCQPDVPVAPEHFDRFIATLAETLHLPDPAALAARCRALLPVYQLKWSCILLNDFTGLGRERRVFSLGAEPAAARRHRQLTRARAMLGSALQTA